VWWAGLCRRRYSPTNRRRAAITVAEACTVAPRSPDRVIAYPSSSSGQGVRVIIATLTAVYRAVVSGRS